MAATISDVRLQIGDIETPYQFDDPAIQQALDEAAELLSTGGVNIETALGKRAHKLQASIFLVSAFLGRIKNRVVKSIKEGDVSIDYVDLWNQLESWKEELRDIIMKFQDPIELSYDDF
ncbi:hypothetical protein DRP05_13710 [Archaeoglobales archaeon]|nr:MAG: hypothetical protein DRP05_13710 [Archaeoglobales archaeon]